MKKSERLLYLAGPLVYGVVLVFLGIIYIADTNAITKSDILGIPLICTGLLCIPFYCVCSLLVKIIEKKND